MLEPLGVAVHALDLTHMAPGSEIAVLGAGTIGLCILQMARACGAGRAIVIDRFSNRLEAALELGADEVIHMDKHDAVEAALHFFGGIGPQVVFEATDGVDAPGQAVEMVRSGGKIMLVGINAEDEIRFKAGTARRKGLSIKMVRRSRASLPSAVRIAARGQVDLKTIVTQRFSLDQVGEAFERINRGRDRIIKSVVNMAG